MPASGCLFIKLYDVAIKGGFGYYRMYQDTCEKAAEISVLSTAPQTREPRRFKLVLAWTVFGPSAAHAGSWHSSSPAQKTLLQGTYFGSSTSDTRNGLLSISCGSRLTVYVGLCPQLPIALASLLVLPL